MLRRYRIWIFAGLFVLFGGAALISGDDGWRRLWAGMSVLCLGGFALSHAADAIASGEIRLQQSVIRRADRPRIFRIAVIFHAVAGAFVAIVGLWVLFFAD